MITPDNTPFPTRKRPSRNSVLESLDNRSVLLFVSVNTEHRQCVFDNPDAVDCLLAAWRNARDWLVGRYMVMPDHIHLFCAPGRIPIPDFHRWMHFWKSLAARTFPVPHSRPLWQRQCWDTQIRSGEDFSEKWEYIRANPVRKGLATRPEDWPFQGTLFPFAWRDR